MAGETVTSKDCTKDSERMTILHVIPSASSGQRLNEMKNLAPASYKRWLRLV